MKSKKSLLALLLALAMIFTLAACGGQDAEEEPAADDQATEQTDDAGEALVEADKGDVEEVAIKVITAALDGDADAYVSYLDPEYLAYLESKGVDEASLKEKIVSASAAYKDIFAGECGDDYKIENSVFKSVAIDTKQSDPAAVQQEIDDLKIDFDIGIEFSIDEDDDYAVDFSNAEAIARVGIESEAEGSKGDMDVENKWLFVKRDGKWYMAVAREVRTSEGD